MSASPWWVVRANTLRGPRGGLATIATSYAVLAITLISSIALARGLEVAERGEIALYITIAALGYTIVAFGWPHAFSWRAMQGTVPLDRLRRSAVDVAIRQAACLLVLAGSISAGLAAGGGPAGKVVLLGLYAASLLLLNYVSLFAQVEDLRRFNVARLLPVGLNAVLLGVLLATGRLDVTSGLAASAASVVLTLLLLLGTRPCASIVVRRSRVDDPEMTSYARRNVAAILATTLNSRAEQLLLPALLGARALGVYVVAAGAALAVVPLLSGWATAAYRDVGAAADPRPLMRRLEQRALATGTAWLIAFVVVAPAAVPAVYGAKFSAAVPVAQVLAVGAIFAGLGVAYEEIARATGRPGAILRAQIAGAATTVLGALVAGWIGSLLVAAAGASTGYLVSAAVLRRAVMGRGRATAEREEGTCAV